MLRLRGLEIIVGSFMLAGILALLVLSFKVSGLTNYAGKAGYEITADFDNIGSLKVRSPVTIAGVRVGEVKKIKLDSTTFKARVTMRINAEQSKIPDDSTAKILTEGLLGSNYISFIPGYEEQFLTQGSQIEETYSALILENLIGQFLFSINEKKKEK